jgi:hypothetical protein
MICSLGGRGQDDERKNNIRISSRKKNETVNVETDLTEEELVKGINSKLVKIHGEYLHDSKQHAWFEGELPVVSILY